MTTSEGTQANNVNPAELAKFDAIAARWWDSEGDFRPLHDINPLRVDYIAQRTDLAAGPVLDVGCGGGLLCEALAVRGARVTGIDMATKALGVARLHSLDAGVDVDYQETTAEQLAQTHAGAFRTVTCLEVLEHVPDYASTIAACAALTTPGGDVFLATINRHPKAYVTAVLGAEYVLGILPKGTHDYAGFIRPAELAHAARAAGLEVCDIVGMTYNPFTRQARLSKDVNVNYLLHARKS